ncbi:MAG: bifunctional diaminohydroxyphosphoribosylaminopyrimidine deaminase/5-amino-6-(5-phosphoribosylamino)uracil reductase RibD [bacterium JZ-2024 1]
MKEYYEYWMRECFALARKAEGLTHPNPLVGCVIVKDGVVVGRGTHWKAGLPHAEQVALKEAGDKARGATLFVNLEPCNHWGKTPPCATLIVDAGIKKVVAAITDPHPLVQGRGFAYLRQKGVEVVEGILEKEARALNAPFLHWSTTGKPYVTVKIAMSLDGKVALNSGESRWITSEESRRDGHYLRFLSDAIMVGSRTVNLDNPQLTVRLWHSEVPKQPKKIVLSGSLNVRPDAAVFTPPQSALLMTCSDNSAVMAQWEKNHVEVVRLPGVQGKIPIQKVLEELGKREILHLLVEGGASLFQQFIQERACQKVVFYIAPRIMGSQALSFFPDLSINRLEEMIGGHIEQFQILGNDVKIVMSLV